MTEELRLEIGDPGSAPAAGESAVDERDVYAPPPLEPSLNDLPEWSVASVGFVLGLVFFGLHLTLGRGGPDDAFLPSDRQKREMAEPGAAWLNRSARLRRLSPLADPASFFGHVGEFVVAETRRVADYRAGRADGEAFAPTIEEEIAHFGIRETTAAPPAEATGPAVRAWRPPSFEPEP